jgi:hypothetical protein
MTQFLDRPFILHEHLLVWVVILFRAAADQKQQKLYDTEHVRLVVSKVALRSFKTQ